MIEFIKTKYVSTERYTQKLYKFKKILVVDLFLSYCMYNIIYYVVEIECILCRSIYLVETFSR